MGVSRVDYDNETLIDLSNDTVTSQTLAKGYTAHNSNGERIVGTMISEGGEGVSNILRVNLDLDLSTIKATNPSHSAIEVLNAHEDGAMIQGILNFADPDTGAPAQILMTPTLVVNAQFAYVVEFSVVAIISNVATLLNVQLFQMADGETEVNTYTRFLSVMA